MGCGASKVSPYNASNFTKQAVSVEELVLKAEELHGKRVTLVGIAKNAGKQLQTPFGGTKCLAAEIVGYVNHGWVEAWHKNGQSHVLRDEQIVPFSVVQGNKEVSISMPDSESHHNKHVHLWLKTVTKEASIRWDDSQKCVVVGAEWPEETEEGCKAGAEASPKTTGRQVPRAAKFWEAHADDSKLVAGPATTGLAEEKGTLEKPENFNYKKTGAQHFYVKRRMVREMAMMEGEPIAVVGEVRFVNGKVELHAGADKALLVSNNKRAEKALKSVRVGVTQEEEVHQRSNAAEIVMMQ